MTQEKECKKDIIGDFDGLFENLLKNVSEGLTRQFKDFVESVKNLKDVNYNKLDREDQEIYLNLKKRYGDLMMVITRVCNKSIELLNEMKHCKEIEIYEQKINNFNFSDYNELITETQKLTIEVNQFKIKCQKYSEEGKPVSYALSSVSILAGTMAIHIVTTVCLPIAIPGLVTGLILSSGLSGTLALINKAIEESYKDIRDTEIKKLQENLDKVESHLKNIAAQGNKVIDHKGDYGRTYKEMEIYRINLEKEVKTLRNLATLEITF